MHTWKGSDGSVSTTHGSQWNGKYWINLGDGISMDYNSDVRHWWFWSQTDMRCDPAISGSWEFDVMLKVTDAVSQAHYDKTFGAPVRMVTARIEVQCDKFEDHEYNIMNPVRYYLADGTLFKEVRERHVTQRAKHGTMMDRIAKNVCSKRCSGSKYDR